MNLKVLTTAALLVLGSASIAANLFAADGATPPPPPPPPAQGQGPGAGPGGPGGARGMNLEGRMKMLTEALGITEAQKTKISPIIADEIKELQAIRKDDALDRKAKMDKSKSVRDSYKAKIRAELTPEQVAKLEANAASARVATSRNDPLSVLVLVLV